MNHNRLLGFLSFTVFIIGAIQLLLTINPIAQDDTFVYYTYARNLVEGRTFAYDVRNIPSEGFTSLIYLLLLSPFEFFGVNMLFASVVINVSAIILTIWIAYRLAFMSAVFNQSDALIFASLLWVLIVNEPNIINIINLGLETMLGPLVILIATWAIWGMSSSNPLVSKRALTIFFVILFISYLVRPESFAFISVIGFPLLITQPTLSRRRIFISVIIFSALFITYHLIKLAIFGDILPTGFYRKTTASNGFGYVYRWITTYIVWIIPLVGIVLINLIQLIRRNHTLLIKQRWAWFLCGITIITLLFFVRTEPLVGYYFRFLMSPTFIVYISFLMVVVWAISQIMRRIEQKISIPNQYRVIMIFILLVAFSTLISQITALNGKSLWDGMNIYDKSVKASETQIYMQFSNHLNQSLDNPQNISMLFGDAGAIPYVFRGQFIDFNGLTEPPIARLFTMPDGKEKTRQFIDYVLAQNPDIVFLGWGDVHDGVWVTPKNNHSPFEKPIPIELFRAYYDFGIRYVCSFYSNYYEVHLGIWIQSPYYADVLDALISYCQTNGYTLANGITVLDLQTQQEVHFEGVSTIMIPPRDN